MAKNKTSNVRNINQTQQALKLYNQKKEEKQNPVLITNNNRIKLKKEQST